MYQDGSDGMEHSFVPHARDGSIGVITENSVVKPLLTEFERQQLMAWNNTQQAYPQELCIPQLVERQAEATPAGAYLGKPWHRVALLVRTRQHRMRKRRQHPTGRQRHRTVLG